MWLRYWAGTGFGLVILAICMVLFLREPAIAVTAANGTYVNDCCGELLVRDGNLSFGTEKSVSFAIGRDESGPFILPATYIGPWEESGFEVDGSRPPLKLRLDALPNPATIELYAAGHPYSFKKKIFRVPQPARMIRVSPAPSH
jgi:hypothetical protein